MKLRSRSRRWAAHGGVAVAVVTLAAGMQAMAASAAVNHTAAAQPANPYAPAYHHPYRHGAVPTRPQLARMRAWSATHPAATATPGRGSRLNTNKTLAYGGAIDGTGVTTGKEKVYLVFYGSQWGTQGTNGSGYATFSGDPSGVAPRLQALFKGLGTSSEKWSGVMTQYCQGVALGATSCPVTAAHVAYPYGGPLAGVWEDTSAASPAAATGHQLAVEAIAAAAHFGNTTARANRNAQYVILSPTGTDPDNWLDPQYGYCAWHDYNGDPTLSGGAASSPYGDIAFTNFPYVTDVGATCGASFVNAGSAGALDGVSIVEGHEYAETITDQNPAGGWTVHDPNSKFYQWENADLCAWDVNGPALAQNLTLPTGTFAMQPTWSNDQKGCSFSHSIVPTQLLKNPGFETGALTPWTATSGVLQKAGTYPAHSGHWLARLDGRNAKHTDTLAQKLAVGSVWHDSSFSFYLQVRSNGSTSAVQDKLTVQVLSSTGKVLKTLATFSNRTARNAYALHSYSMKAFIGKTISIKFTGTETAGHNTAFLVDDNALRVS
jgi:hypothetical protein